MSTTFLAQPPPRFGRGLTELGRLLRMFGDFIWDAITFFGTQPIAPARTFTLGSATLPDEQFSQCEKIFEEVEETRLHLEQKAQTTFGIVVFVAPLLVSAIVFLLSEVSATFVGYSALSMVMISALFLLLGFSSTVRALSIRTRTKLFVEAVIDPVTGDFRHYRRWFHAQGLLHCAVLNQATNDHIAQLVKGAHGLTAAAVITMGLAAIPVAFEFTGTISEPTAVALVRSTPTPIPELTTVTDELRQLRLAVEKAATNEALEAELAELRDRLSNLEKRLNPIEPKSESEKQE